MRYTKTILSLYLTILLTIVSNAQGEKSFIRHLGGEEGVPGPHIFHVTEDSKGYIWLCTISGLAKYDGYNLVNYHAISIVLY